MPVSKKEARTSASGGQSPGHEPLERYEAAVDAHRAALYARLHRRFPLRIAAPR